MMKKPQILARASLLTLTFALHSFADDRYIIRVQPSVIDSVAKQHKLKVDRRLSDEGVYLVSLPKSALADAALEALQANAAVQSVESNVGLKLPEVSGYSNQGKRRAPYLKGGTPSIPMPGSPWAPYVNQPANGVIRLQDAHKHYGYGNTGVQVAIIDTGVDYQHDILKYVLNTTDARNFINGGADASTSQETTPFVDQETTPFVDGIGAIVLNQETTPFVDQETTPFVDQETTPFVDGKAWGHGTIVAGIVHLVVPNARILPLRAFKSDGSGSLADVIAAIEYAVSLGNVQVINMSFSAPDTSPSLNAAIEKAAANGIICVASVANNGAKSVVYPSNIGPVIGVGATTNDDYRAFFSNYGSDTDVGAPGVEVVSTYPRDKNGKSRYATVSGTSFSTAFVTGTVAFLRSVDSKETASDANDDLEHGSTKVKSPEFPAGRLDVFKTLNLGKN